MNKLIKNAADLRVASPSPFLSVSPVVLPNPGRVVDLEVRVSAPVSGDALPIILLSHGHGSANYLSSLKGCAPLADFWAALDCASSSSCRFCLE